MASGNFTLGAPFEAVSYQTWREAVEATLKGKSVSDRFGLRTADGIAVAPIYSHEDGQPGLGAPGLVGGSRGVGWECCPRVDHPDVATAAQQIRSELARGAESVWLALDRVTRLGIDPSRTDPGRAPDGVVALGRDDLTELLGAVDLKRHAVFLDGGLNGLPVAAALALQAEKQGVALSELRGSIDCDPVSAVIRDRALPGDPLALQRALGELIAWAHNEAPRLRTLCVSTEIYHDRQATPVMELARMLSNGVRYLRWFAARGLDVDAICRQMRFILPVTADVFPEIAKLRAARWLWAHAVKACGGGDAAQAMHLHAVGAWRSQTRRDPWVNLLRATAHTLIGASGGAQMITTRPYDELYGLPGEDAQRLAANTQQILREESYLGRVADPTGGAYYVDSLTRALASHAWEAFQQLEGEGDIEDELFDARRVKVWREVGAIVRQQVRTRRKPVTGVSEFPLLDERVPPAHEQSVSAFWRACARRAADASVVDTSDLAAATEHADADGRLVAMTIAALRAGASVSDLASALFVSGPLVHPRGEPQVTRWRDAESFEGLRDQSDRIMVARGRRPQAFLANLGSIPRHKARASFASNLLIAGGIEALPSDGYCDADAVVRGYAASGADGAIITGADEDYASLAVEVAQRLRDNGARFVGIVARPGAEDAAWGSAGVGAWLYVGCDAVGLLQSLLDQVGGAA